jgi:hypothetical protein
MRNEFNTLQSIALLNLRINFGKAFLKKKLLLSLEIIRLKIHYNQSNSSALRRRP